MSAPRRLRVDLQNCPACDAMHLLSVNRIEVSYNRQGQRSDKARNLIDRLWLDPEQAKSVEEIKDRLYATPSDGAPPPAFIAPVPSEAMSADDRGVGSTTDDAEAEDESIDAETGDAGTGQGHTHRTEGGMGL
jgi:hypothetical protein